MSHSSSLEMSGESQPPILTEATVPNTGPGDEAFSRRFLRSLVGVQNKGSITERYMGLAVLATIIGAFWVASPYFMTRQNFEGVGGENSVQALMSLGLLFPLAAGVFDVSVSSTFSLAVVASTALFQATNGSFPIPLDIVLMLLGAVVIGLINGGLVVKLRLDPFIATIGSGALILAVSEIIGNGQTISNHIPASFSNLGVMTWGGIPTDIFLVLVVALFAWYILEQTPAGRALYATGAGLDIANLIGVRTSRAITWGYIGSALGAAVAGILFAAQQAAGPPDTGSSYLLPAYATVFLGATMIRPGRFNVLGLLVAVCILSLGINGFELVGGPFWVPNIFEGVVLIGAVALSNFRTAR